MIKNNREQECMPCPSTLYEILLEQLDDVILNCTNGTTRLYKTINGNDDTFVLPQNQNTSPIIADKLENNINMLRCVCQVLYELNEQTQNRLGVYRI